MDKGKTPDNMRTEKHNNAFQTIKWWIWFIHSESR